MSFKEILAIIIILIILIAYIFIILRMYILLIKITKDNEKLKKFLKLIEEE